MNFVKNLLGYRVEVGSRGKRGVLVSGKTTCEHLRRVLVMLYKPAQTAFFNFNFKANYAFLNKTFHGAKTSRDGHCGNWL